TNVRLLSARPHRNADARCDEIDLASGYDLADLHEVIKRRPAHDHEIIAFIGVHALENIVGTGPGGVQLVTAQALELRHEFRIGGLDGVGTQDIDGHVLISAASGAPVNNRYAALRAAVFDTIEHLGIMVSLG